MTRASRTLWRSLSIWEELTEVQYDVAVQSTAIVGTVAM